MARRVVLVYEPRFQLKSKGRTGVNCRAAREVGQLGAPVPQHQGREEQSLQKGESERKGGHVNRVVKT